jgi:hypothetical protein
MDKKYPGSYEIQMFISVFIRAPTGQRVQIDDDEDDHVDGVRLRL